MITGSGSYVLVDRHWLARRRCLLSNKAQRKAVWLLVAVVIALVIMACRIC